MSSGNRVWNCFYCPITFPSWDYLNSHLQNVHHIFKYARPRERVYHKTPVAVIRGDIPVQVQIMDFFRELNRRYTLNFSDGEYLTMLNLAKQKARNESDVQKR